MIGVKPVPEPLEMNEIYELGSRYPIVQDRALIYFLYLTGCRVSEALACRIRDLQERETREFGNVLTVKLITLKNRRQRIRIIPIPMNKHEGPMLKVFQKFIKGMAPEQRIFAGLKSRMNVCYHLAKHELTTRAVHDKEILDEFTFKVHPHYMRHCRLTHMVTYYGFGETKLVRFAGWTNSKPAQVYVALDWDDLARSMTDQNGW